MQITQASKLSLCTTTAKAKSAALLAATCLSLRPTAPLRRCPQLLHTTRRPRRRLPAALPLPALCRGLLVLMTPVVLLVLLVLLLLLVVPVLLVPL